MNISIIIPCYNSAQYINECIHSILCQDYDKDTVSDSIFGWLADFIKWLFRI